jgi:predicted peptidase
MAIIMEKTQRMINRREFCFALGLALLHRQNAAGQKADFIARSFDNSRGEKMPYRLFIPQDYDKRNKYPLALWLHGGAGRGSDNLKQISGGNTIGSHVWTYPANQQKHPCFVVAPQCPEGEFWATTDSAKPTKQLRLVVELLEDLQKEFNLDERRFYAAGQSLGGFGTWAIISEHADMFAAAMPICGGGNEAEAVKLKSIPIWAFHGERDEAVSVERSRKMIAAIKQAGGIAKYTEYKGAGHAIWQQVFSEPDLLTWTFAQTNKWK